MNAPEQRPVLSASVDAVWTELAAAEDMPRRSALWLRCLTDMIPGCNAALVMLENAAGAMEATASLPAGLDPKALTEVVQQTLELGVLAVRAVPHGHQLALPVLHAGHLRGVVALSLWSSDGDSIQQAQAAVRWGMGWLCGAPTAAIDAPQALRTRQAIDLAASLVNEPGFKPAAMALAEQLNRSFASRLVQVGWNEPAGARLVVRSHTAWHDGRAQLVALAEQAMNEALDQGVCLTWPAPVQADLLARMAQEAYARAAGGLHLLAVPLRAQGMLVGALLMEREHPYSTEEAEAADALASLLGPLLQLRHVAEQSLTSHLRRASRASLAWAVGGRHAGWKLMGGLASLVLLLAAWVPTAHRVTAPAVLEGQTQRAAVAPFAGYIRSASARAGDSVELGQVIATLDDRDLRLEQTRWESELELATRKEREALAGMDRSALRQMAAQVAQAQAQLELVRDKLSRVEIRAPFAGVVVKGDLSQLLGAPVEVGKVLFELAPLEAWRVILKVDERDIAWVRQGRAGELVLRGLAGQSHAVVVERVLSVAEAEEGRNQFRVEARLSEAAVGLRPGMEGVAKISVGEASFLWVWTHRASDWLRRTVWEWSP